MVFNEIKDMDAFRKLAYPIYKGYESVVGKDTLLTLLLILNKLF